jgi:hypothetical protein
MLGSGEASQMGEGAEELFKDAIDYQLQHQIGPVPFVRPAIALIVAGIVVSLIGLFMR